MFDVGGDDFMIPPSISAWICAGWYNYSGHLIGVRLQADCYESFSSTVTMTHFLYNNSGNTELCRVDSTIVGGTDIYYVDLFQTLTVGEYSVRVYFAEFPVGACAFRVIEGDNKFTLENIDENGNSFPVQDTLFR
jgi:hypothetical protein